MSSRLPYFPWYPKDCDIDEDVRMMNDEEFGFFVRCLNHSWMNDGLPVGVEEISRCIGRTLRYTERVWQRVGRCFVLQDNRLRNPRQERERVIAASKSTARSAAANARWDKQATSKSNAIASDLQCYPDPDPDAYPKPEETHTQKQLRAPLAADESKPSARFEEFWQKYPRKQHRVQAGQAYVSVVTSAVESQVFACLDRYVDSDEVARGVVLNPEKWLFEQSSDGWAGMWPARNGTEKTHDAAVKAAVERLMR